MNKILLVIIVVLSCFDFACKKSVNSDFPDELVNFMPYKSNPVFSGTGAETWDKNIRERGYILKEDSLYHLWFTGYKNENSVMHLGYATSKDGISWTRFSENPIYEKGWVEDMCVIKSDGIYYMFAEGKNDIAHLLTSSNRVNWTEKGNLDIRMKNGKPISKGAYGTPAVWKEGNIWYLFYERGDLGIWLATSKNLKVWTNIQDKPVIEIGQEKYDKYAVAMNQIIKYEGKYYGYYHASAFEDWREWTVNVAVSDDLIHWKKYPKNPILKENKSSGILVEDGKSFRLYTMHDKVNLHFSKKKSKGK